MDIVDFMFWKMIALAVIAFLYGLMGGFKDREK